MDRAKRIQESIDRMIKEQNKMTMWPTIEESIKNKSKVVFKWQVQWKRKYKNAENWRKCKTFGEALSTAFRALLDGYWNIKIKRA